MKREITIKNCLVTDTEMSETPAFLNPITSEIELADYMYALQDHHNEIYEGLNELEKQHKAGKQICHFRNENIVMTLITM